MVNDAEERGLNRVKHLDIKVHRHPRTSSLDIINHIKPNVRKEPSKRIIPAGTKLYQIMPTIQQ